MASTDFYVLNENFEMLSSVDSYDSLIWTDRYSDAGDFEVYIAASTEAIDLFRQNYYVKYPESEHTMIIDYIEVTTDVENGNKLIVRGESLESILKRRIIWNQTVLNGDLQSQIEKLLNENIIKPSAENRIIDNFIFEKSTDERILSLTIDAQFTGETLYDAIKSICDDANLGFKILLNDQNQFIFSLYMGEDHSYSQDYNPYVIVSKSFDNIISSDYLMSTRPIRNVALVAGEGEGSARKTIITGDNSQIGLDRRELYVDARDISSQTSEGTLSEVDYNAQLRQRGREKLAENRIQKSFDGEVDSLGEFQYYQDYFMGDIIQFEDEYGYGGRARVIEYIYSVSSSGIEFYPTLNMLDTSVMPTGNTVTYIWDGNSNEEIVRFESDCLHPYSFEPIKVGGYMFMGWSERPTSTIVLTEKLMGTEPITLYAVWKMPDQVLMNDYYYDYRPWNNGRFATVYTIDSSKFSSHTIQGQVTGDYGLMNPTSGWVTNRIYVSGRFVRGRKKLAAGSVNEYDGINLQPDGQDSNPGNWSNAPGAFGGIFTLTNCTGNLTINTPDPYPVPYPNVTFRVIRLTGIGKLIVG